MAFNPMCRVTCLRCGAQHQVRRSAFERRSGVHCTRCGGPVEPSEAAREAMVRGMDRKRQLARA